MIDWTEVELSRLDPNRVSYSLEGEMGRSMRDMEARAKAGRRPPPGKRAGKSPPVYAPPLTPEEKAIIKRKSTNSKRVYPSILQRIHAQTKTFFDEDGRIIEANQRGNVEVAGLFLPVVVVSKQEHLRRLKLAYEGIWKHLEAISIASGHKNGILQSQKRVSLLKKGKYVCPLNFKGNEFTLNAYRRERFFLFFSYQSEQSCSSVSLKEYDRRLRLFLFNLWTKPYRFGWLRDEHNKHLSHSSPKEAIIRYLVSPQA